MDLKTFYSRFPKQSDCIKYLEEIQWEGTPVCPYCQSTRQSPMPREQRYHCNNCRASFSVTTKTIFHKTKVELQKWFFAIRLVQQYRVSARQLAKNIEVTKDTACFMVNRIKNAANEQSDIIKTFLN